MGKFPGADHALSVCFIFACVCAVSQATEKLPAGWVERVRLYPGNLELRAKLDTGADISSLHARRLKQFRRDGRQWISFDIADGADKLVRLEKPVVRTSRIRRHGGKVEERPVVMLGICLGNFYKDTEVNLVDRVGFEYPMLIGRAFMASHVIVDPSRSYATDPACTVTTSAP